MQKDTTTTTTTTGTGIGDGGSAHPPLGGLCAVVSHTLTSKELASDRADTLTPPEERAASTPSPSSSPSQGNGKTGKKNSARKPDSKCLGAKICITSDKKLPGFYGVISGGGNGYFFVDISETTPTGEPQKLPQKRPSFFRPDGRVNLRASEFIITEAGPDGITDLSTKTRSSSGSSTTSAASVMGVTPKLAPATPGAFATSTLLPTPAPPSSSSRKRHTPRPTARKGKKRRKNSPQKRRGKVSPSAVTKKLAGSFRPFSSTLLGRKPEERMVLVVGGSHSGVVGPVVDSGNGYYAISPVHVPHGTKVDSTQPIRVRSRFLTNWHSSSPANIPIVNTPAAPADTGRSDDDDDDDDDGDYYGDDDGDDDGADYDDEDENDRFRMSPDGRLLHKHTHTPVSGAPEHLKEMHALKLLDSLFTASKRADDVCRTRVMTVEENRAATQRAVHMAQARAIATDEAANPHMRMENDRTRLVRELTNMRNAIELQRLEAAAMTGDKATRDAAVERDGKLQQRAEDLIRSAKGANHETMASIEAACVETARDIVQRMRRPVQFQFQPTQLSAATPMMMSSAVTPTTASAATPTMLPLPSMFPAFMHASSASSTSTSPPFAASSSSSAAATNDMGSRAPIFVARQLLNEMSSMQT